MKSRRARVRASQIDLIPMIDVVFQLILFFLVSTTFAVLPGISVNLPHSSTAKGGETSGITITAESDGSVWLNGDKVGLDGLNAALADYDTGDTERGSYPIQLEADDLVTNGTIVKLFDILRKNGFSAVNLRTTER